MNGLISLWQRLVHEAGEDWSNAANIAFDRKKWKAFVQQRHKQLLEWEETVVVHGRKQEVVSRR